MTRPKNGTTPPAFAVDAVAAQRSLIEALLVTHAQLDVYTMLTASVSGAGITYEQIRYARKRMIREGKPVWAGPRPPRPQKSTPAPRTRPVKIDPSELLRRAMMQMFERKAQSLGCSVATAKILTLYSTAQIAAMAGAKPLHQGA